MRPSGPTFWLLGGLAGWRTSRVEGVSVSDRKGIRLAANPEGLLSLESSDGSLGALLLPRGMAFDTENTLYLLGADAPWIKKFDAQSRTFVRLPDVGGEGNEPRQFSKPSNIAIAGRRIYVADTGNRRVQAFDLHSLALTDIWERPGWTPLDVAAHNDRVFILDSENARVYAVGRTGRLGLLLERSERKDQWKRLAIDRKGQIYMLNVDDPTRPLLESTDAEVKPLADAGDVRDQFTSPSIRLDSQGRFCLPESLSRPCARKQPDPPPPLEVELELCPPFDRVRERCATPKPPVAKRSAVAAHVVYVIDREQRVVRAFLEDGRKLRHKWGPWDAAGMAVKVTDPSVWEPADVAAIENLACILDTRYQTVYRHQSGREGLRPIITSASPADWSRIALGESGFIYLYSPGKPNTQVYTCGGELVGESPYRDVAKLFERAPAIQTESTGLIFNRQGEPVESVNPSMDTSEPLYMTSGTWRSEPLDSLKYRCQWHRIELFVSGLPPGSKIEIWTYSSDNPADFAGLPETLWQPAAKIVAPVNPPECEQQEEVRDFDFMVQSGGGQYLAIQLKLSGDGYSTPAIRSMRVHYPRESYLNYLPAVYSSDDESRIFLERFLSAFQTEWDDLNARVGETERYFDPDAVPAGPFLDYLAKQWLALPLEAGWTPEQKRRLLSAVPKIYPRRGQSAGLRDYLHVYLTNMANLETKDAAMVEYPAILEGFRERQHLFLSQENAANLGHGAPLWSPAIVGRLQLGVYSREGEVELVSTGDPRRDVFQEYAHRFRVLVPAGWVRTESDERMIRRAIDAEKPAHTSYDLCLIEPRFRIGVQSSLGLDTIIGDFPVMTLGCETVQDTPPSLPPSNRLGYDTILSAPKDSPNPPETTVGKDSVLR